MSLEVIAITILLELGLFAIWANRRLRSDSQAKELPPPESTLEQVRL